MAVSNPKPIETKQNTNNSGDQSAQTDHDLKLVPIMTEVEQPHFQELGLGRGIDSSDPQMWKNKSPTQIRMIHEDLGNIIATDESGIKNSYEKTVASLKTQQSKIQSSLSDPTSRIKIGLDAHYSQSSSSTVTIKGTKVNTRTISFRNAIEDLPVDSEHTEFAFFPKEQSTKDEGYRAFETNLATWILKKLLDDQKNGTISPTPDIIGLKGKTSIEKLGNYTEQIQGIDSIEARAIELACRTFISEFRITHYVSAIELGALRYSVQTARSQSSTKGLGGNIGASYVVTASASASTDISHKVTTRSKQEREIGYFTDSDKGTVQKEAVIGFQIQPVSKLVRLSKVRLALIVALEVYLQSKTDDTVGPFLISTSINKKPVYWKVDQEQLSLIGTEDVKAASPFYIISAGDQFSPSKFTIAYWGDKKSDRKLITNMTSPLSQERPTIPKLPAFLTTTTSNAPLLFKYTFNMKTAQYTVHSRIYSSFACFTSEAGPASVQTLLEGDEFYIKHSPRAFKSVYLALKQETGAAESPSYTSTVFPSIRYADRRGIGMLFRLHPQKFKEIGRESSLTMEVEEILPITY